MRYTIYGKSGVFDAERFIDVMQAFENFITAAKSGGGEDLNGGMAELGILQSPTSQGFLLPGFPSAPSQAGTRLQTRAALSFLLSDKGNFFREFLLDEVIPSFFSIYFQLIMLLFVMMSVNVMTLLLAQIVKGIDAVTREQLVQLMSSLGIRSPNPLFSMVPTFGSFRTTALVPTITQEDRIILNNVQKVVEFLTEGTSISRQPSQVKFARMIAFAYTHTHYMHLELINSAANKSYQVF